ncbi:MAG: magnesium transporter [Gammaproteobacteria bacterium]|nr:magnesium transporter [Gammaproteobacteria bacterium]
MRQVRRMIAALKPAEIAHLLESLPPPQRQIVWELVDHDDEGDVLVELNEDVRGSLMRDMDSEQIVAAAANLDLDDLADLLAELPETINREVLRSLDASDRLRLETVLRYAEDSAGGLMNLDTLTVRGDVTVEVVLRYLRMRREIPRGTDAIYVVDRNNRYLGSLFITSVLTADPEQRVSEIMDAETPAIAATTPAQEVVTLFEDLDLVSAAVVDENERLLGRITIDDVVDVMRDEANHSVLSMAGLDEEDDTFAGVGVSARRRSIWLGMNVVTAFLAAWVAGLFEATLEEVVMLAILMPIVPSMGGVAGTQTLILIIRNIALGRMDGANARWLLGRELGVAALNSAVWAGVVALISSFWFNTWTIGLVIALALSINLVCGAASGFAIPLLLKRLNIDPAIAGGVMLIMITDVIGLLAFLGLGTLILR